MSEGSQAVTPPARPVFEVRTYFRGDRAVIAMTGELDLATALRLKTAALDVWRAGPVGVVLDMERLAFCDSAGLTVLIFIWRGCQERGLRLVLAGVDPHVESVLRITNLLPHFERARSVHDALAADSDGQPLEPA